LGWKKAVAKGKKEVKKRKTKGGRNKKQKGETTIGKPRGEMYTKKTKKKTQKKDRGWILKPKRGVPEVGTTNPFWGRASKKKWYGKVAFQKRGGEGN